MPIDPLFGLQAHGIDWKLSLVFDCLTAAESLTH